MSRKKEEKKECIINLTQYIGKAVSVDLVGGRKIKGILRGFDETSNIALDDAIEYIPPAFTQAYKHFNGKRTVGFVFVRGQTVITVYEEAMAQQIENPF